MRVIMPVIMKVTSTDSSRVEIGIMAKKSLIYSTMNKM